MMLIVDNQHHLLLIGWINNQFGLIETIRQDCLILSDQDEIRHSLCHVMHQSLDEIHPCDSVDTDSKT
jgi:hypothetical protein